MRIFKIVASSVSVVIAGGLILAGCSGNISILAIVLGYLLATGAAFTLTGCGEEDDTGPQIVTNPASEDFDEDSFYDYDDCDDSDAQVNPGAMEICDDGKDNDCDNDVDMDDSDCEDIVINPAPEDIDEDGDGFVGDEDCLEGNAAVNPDADEDCFDGIDNDCDMLVDDADEECAEIVVNPAPEDGDGDGFYEWEDCRDDEAAINPDADEDCSDGIDNDCDQLIDMEDPECTDIVTNPMPEDY